MLAFDPYPFALDRVDIPVTASLVPDRPYSTPEDFIATLAAAGHTTIECVAVRP